MDPLNVSISVHPKVESWFLPLNCFTASSADSTDGRTILSIAQAKIVSSHTYIWCIRKCHGVDLQNISRVCLLLTPSLLPSWPKPPDLSLDERFSKWSACPFWALAFSQQQKSSMPFTIQAGQVTSLFALTSLLTPPSHSEEKLKPFKPSPGPTWKDPANSEHTPYHSTVCPLCSCHVGSPLVSLLARPTPD